MIDVVTSAALSSPLAMGAPARADLKLNVLDRHAQTVRGPLVQSILLKLSDPHHHVSLSCNVVWDTRYEPIITSDGYGDAFSIAVTALRRTHTWNFTTSLPKDVPLSTHSWQTTPQFLRFGSDGNMWAPLDYNAAGLSVLRIRTNGRTNIFTSPDTHIEIPVKQMLEGGDGNMWIPYESQLGDVPGGMIRVSPSGHFTEFPLPSAEQYDEITAFIWARDRFIIGATVGYSESEILSFDGLGNYVRVAAFHGAPKNFVLDRVGNVWFLNGSGNRSKDIRVGKLDRSGRLSLFRLCCVNDLTGSLSLVLGPDGKIWFPYPYGAHVLLKVDESGAVVSRETLPYNATWDLSTPRAPIIVDYASDDRGDLYAADEGGDGSAFGGIGIIRFEKGGGVSEFPTFHPVGGEPSSIVYDSNTARLYAANIYGASEQFSEGSIVVIDPKYW